MEQKDPNAKEGMRVRLVSMVDDPNPVAPGTEGTISLVDGMGVIHVKWDDGRTLGLIPGVDHYQLSPNSNTDLYDDTNKMFESSSGGAEIKSAIKKTPAAVNKSMPKSTKLSSSASSSLKSAGIKTGQVKKSFSSAGIKDIKVESNQIKGGKADNLTVKDLAKKHGVSVKQIEKEIELGIPIEKEHVGNDIDKAREIAMDHVFEFKDFYSNKRYGAIATEKGLKKTEKKEKVDYMSAGGGGTTTSSVGGVNGMGYTSPAAWAPGGILTKKTGVAEPGPVKEATATFYSTSTQDFKYKQYDDNHLGKDSWADTNSDGWRFNDAPFYEEGTIIDPLAKIESTWDDEKLDISSEWDKLQDRAPKNKMSKKITETTSLLSALGDHSPVTPLQISDDDNDDYNDVSKGTPKAFSKDDDYYAKPNTKVGGAKKISKKSLKKEDFMRMVKTRLKESKEPTKYYVTQNSGPGTKVVKGPMSKAQAEAFANAENEKFIKQQETIRKGQTTSDAAKGVPLRKEKYKKFNVITDKELDNVGKGWWDDLESGNKNVELDETTTFGSVWGSNGPPVGPAFAAKKGEWKMVKKPIWKGGTIVQKDDNEGIMNPINEVNKVKYNPNGKYVKIKKKCTKFPYCNQGAIDNPLEITNSTDSGNYIAENMKTIHEIAKKTGKSFDEVYKIVKEQMKLR